MLAGAVLFNGHSLAANYWSGNQLFEQYGKYVATQTNPTSDGLGAMGVYLGYIRASYEFIGMIDKQACIPDAAEINQFARIVGRYMEQNPNRLHEPAFTIVIESLRQAFPCR